MDKFCLKLAEIISWIDNNKEWLFSGIGLSGIMIIYKLGSRFNKRSRLKLKRKSGFKGTSNIEKKELNCGSTYFFGHIPDTGDLLEWIIVQKKENELLLLCKDIIYEKEYDVIEKRNWRNKDEKLTWDSSSLCYYLNSYFFDKAFKTDERQRIICKGSQFVSLLDKNEIDKLSIADRQGKDSSGTEKEWWINTAGIYRKDNIMYVDVNGNVDTIGYRSDKEIGVRPTLWIRI